MHHRYLLDMFIELFCNISFVSLSLSCDTLGEIGYGLEMF